MDYLVYNDDDELVAIIKDDWYLVCLLKDNDYTLVKTQRQKGGGSRPFLFDNLKNFCYNKYIEKNMKGENPMLKINLNELSALEFVLNYISVKDLLTFATLGFAENSTERNQDNADICTKSLQVFLR